MLKARVATALLLAAGLLGVVFLLPKPAADAAFALVAALAAWEWAGLMKADRPARVLYGLLSLAFCWQIRAVGEPAILLAWIVSAAFWIAVVPLWLRFRWRMDGNDLLGYAVGLLLIVPTWAALASLHQRSPWVLLFAMGLVWVADIAAYFSGRAFGRRKLAPAISPGKTWEGVAGAIAGVLAYGLAVATARDLSAGELLAGAGLLVLLTGISVVGDLFESLVKRQAGVKDSSSLLPGHGGILDRIDSLTSTLPMAALILTWSGK